MFLTNTYDNDGNMTGAVTQASGTVRENMAYTYDFDDRLVRVENRAAWPELVRSGKKKVVEIPPATP